MIISNSSQLGFSITSPFKKVGHVVKRGAQATGHGIKAGAKFTVSHARDVAMLALLPIAELNKLVLSPALKYALRPIRAKVNTLVDRRAKKLAWDRRKSRVPTAPETAEAHQWAKRELLHSTPPFGPVMSLLAGPPPMTFGDTDPAITLLGDPSAATIIASIPVMLAIINALLGKKSQSGEAPAMIGPGGPVPDPNGGGAMMTPEQAAAAAQAAVDAGGGGAMDAGGGADDGDGGGGSRGLPGGITKHHLIIGGVVVGGLVLVSMLLKKKS